MNNPPKENILIVNNRHTRRRAKAIQRKRLKRNEQSRNMQYGVIPDRGVKTD